MKSVDKSQLPRNFKNTLGTSDSEVFQITGTWFQFWNVNSPNFLFSSHTRRKKTDLQFQMMTIYYTIESPRNRDYWKYPQFKHTVKPQDDIVGYYALKQDFKYVVLRNDFTPTLQSCHQTVERCSLAPQISNQLSRAPS